MMNKKVAILLIVLIGFVLYGNTFGNQFIWDDFHQITENVYVKSFDIGKFFEKNIDAGAGQDGNFYRPIALLSFALDYHIWGTGPAGFHFTNTLLHILSAILVYLIFSALQPNKTISFLTSLLFLVHPLQVESVAYISGRTELLPVLFSLLSLYWFIKTFQNPERVGRYYSLSLISFAIALLSKESAAIFPFLLPLVYLTFIDRNLTVKNLKNVGLKTLPFLALAVIYIVLRFTVLSFGDGGFGTTHFDIFTRFFMFAKVLMSYWGILIFPTSLRFRLDQSIPLTSWDPWVIISLVILGIIAYLSVLSFKHKRIVFFGFSWFLIGLIPASGVLISINYILGERWLRLPSIGLFFLVAAGLSTFLSKIDRRQTLKSAVIALIVIYLLFLSVVTIRTNAWWKEPISYFSYLIHYYPNDFGIHINLGIAYDEMGMKEEAFEQYQAALAIDPSQPLIHANLGGYYAEQGQLDLAEGAYLKAIELNKGFALPYQLLAKVYLSQGKIIEAIHILEELRDILPDSWKPYSLLGQVHALNEDYAQAEKYFEKALSLNPENEELQKRLGALKRVSP